MLFTHSEVKHLENYSARCWILEKRPLFVGRNAVLWKGNSCALGSKPPPVFVQNETGNPGTTLWESVP